MPNKDKKPPLSPGTYLGILSLRRNFSYRVSGESCREGDPTINTSQLWDYYKKDPSEKGSSAKGEDKEVVSCHSGWTMLPYQCGDIIGKVQGLPQLVETSWQDTLCEATRQSVKTFKRGASAVQKHAAEHGGVDQVTIASAINQLAVTCGEVRVELLLVSETSIKDGVQNPVTGLWTATQRIRKFYTSDLLLDAQLASLMAMLTDVSIAVSLKTSSKVIPEKGPRTYTTERVTTVENDSGMLDAISVLRAKVDGST